MLQGFRREGGKIKRELQTKTLGYITGGLGLVAGLAWNDAIRSLIEYWAPAGGETVSAKLLYAAVVTVVVVLLSVYLVRLLGERE